VSFEIDPAFEDYLHAHLQTVVQTAVDNSAQAYRDRGIDDVEDRLRSELAERGVEINDQAWLNEAAGMIRAGLPVVVGDSEDLGSEDLGQSSGRHRATE
jgi:TRAP-type C4-dicarboxylate transport system substrate-binding protein